MHLTQVLHVLQDDALDGPTNMARDEHLLHSDTLVPGSLRIYAWDPPTISLGYFQRYSEITNLPDDVRNLAVVRRITGGGAILHDREITYCLVLRDSVPIARKSPIALYRTVHDCWRAALAEDGLVSDLAPESFPMPTPRTGPFFCFQKPGCTDLIVNGQKLLGSAQRRLPDRVLQHGSLLLGRRFASHPGADIQQQNQAIVERWISAFTQRLAAELELTPTGAKWSEEQLADVAERQFKYASRAWTRKR